MLIPTRYRGARPVGITYVEVEVGNPADTSNTLSVEFMVDSGAIYTVAPASVLDELGIEPIGENVFWLANGEKIVRKRGGAYFKYGDKVGIADVIFGEEGDSNLLGATTLESLGLALDPLKRELKPMPLIIGGFRPQV
jgi:aspartyl protease family protein